MSKVKIEIVKTDKMGNIKGDVKEVSGFISKRMIENGIAKLAEKEAATHANPQPKPKKVEAKKEEK